MHAADIMTTPAVTAAPNATILEVVTLMLDNHISALPIVARDGTLVGLVSEGDLIRRSEIGARDYSSWWLAAIGGTARLAEDFVKTHGMTAEEIMSRQVVTVVEDTPIWRIAEMLEKHHIKRVPVMRRYAVVGIVSRANLLQALAAQREKLTQVPSAGDRILRDEVLALLKGEACSDLSHLNIVVQAGIVHYWGLITSESQRQALKVAAESVPGVQGVDDHLHVAVTLA